MLKRFFFASAVVALISLSSTFASCGSAGTGTGGGAGGGGGSADPELTCDASPPATSFSKVYADIFTPACITCHKPGIADGSDSYGLYNTEAEALKQVGKISLYAGSEKMLKVVDPNNLGNSVMYLKVLARMKSPGTPMKNLGGAMPLSAPALNATQKQLLKDWICSGAKP